VTPCILTTRHDSDQVVLDSPYDADFVGAFKRLVPHLDREPIYEHHSVVGDSKTFKYWRFKRGHWAAVTELCLATYSEVYHEHITETGEIDKWDLRTGEKLATQGNLFNAQT